MVNKTNLNWTLYGAMLILVLRTDVIATANDSILSPEESIGALYRVSDTEFQVLMFVNPAVLPVLRKMVTEPEFWSKTAWTALGCVGTERDVALIRRILEKDARGEHAQEKAFKTASAIPTLGLLARRDVSGARKLLAEIQQPAFWEGEPIHLYKGERAEIRGHDEIQALILYAMAYAKDPGVAARFEAICSQIKEPVRLAHWKYRIPIDRLLICGKGLDQVEKKGLDLTRRDDCLSHFHSIPADKRKLMGLPAPPTPFQLAGLRGFWQIRKMQGVAKLRVLSKVEADSLILEAQKEFPKFTLAITQKDVKTMRGSLMSKGELFDRQFRHEDMTHPEITRLETELDRLQMQQRGFVEALSTAKPEAVDAVASLEADAGDYSGKNTDIIVVSWKLKGTQDIGKSILDGKLNYYPTVAEDDNLVVVMKKKDGTWYWNPFGW